MINYIKCNIIKHIYIYIYKYIFINFINAEWAIDRVKIKYIYLDMVTYNKSAGRFYEKNGFMVVRTKLKHYTIENNLYDAYVFIWYVSG